MLYFLSSVQTSLSIYEGGVDHSFVDDSVLNLLGQPFNLLQGDWHRYVSYVVRKRQNLLRFVLGRCNVANTFRQDFNFFLYVQQNIVDFHLTNGQKEPYL